MKDHLTRHIGFSRMADEWLRRAERLDKTAASPELSAAPVPLDKALEFFAAAANLEDMAWGAVRTGCYPKAYLMCEMAMAEGWLPQKAWAFEGDRPMKGSHPSGGDFIWQYHIALSLPVKMPDGRTENLVFDPALFDAPVSLGEWGDKIGAPPEKRAIIAYDQKPPRELSGVDTWPMTHAPEVTAKMLDKVAIWTMNSAPGRVVFRSETLRDLEGTLHGRSGWEVERDMTPRRTTPRLSSPLSHFSV